MCRTWDPDIPGGFSFLLRLSLQPLVLERINMELVWQPVTPDPSCGSQRAGLQGILREHSRIRLITVGL